MSKHGKYGHINFVPPEEVRQAAARGLEIRSKASPSNKGGLDTEEASKEGVGSGVQRATNLKNGDELRPETVRQMANFLSRSEKASKIDEGKSATQDKGYQAWLLWGGDAGKAWADKVVAQMDKADGKRPSFKEAASRAADRALSKKQD